MERHDECIRKNKIIPVVIDKESGHIVTDYIQGETQTVGPAGILGAITTRYKYNISFKKDQTQTRIGIICKLESKTVLGGGDNPPDWHDVTAGNEPLVNNLVNWLYEKIEMSSVQVVNQ